MRSIPAIDDNAGRFPISKKRRQGLEEEILPGELYAADEIFTSHSVTKVAPVEPCEDRALTAPGPVSLELMDLMNDVTTFEVNRFPHWFQTWR